MRLIDAQCKSLSYYATKLECLKNKGRVSAGLGDLVGGYTHHLMLEVCLNA